PGLRVEEVQLRGVDPDLGVLAGSRLARRVKPRHYHRLALRRGLRLAAGVLHQVLQVRGLELPAAYAEVGVVLRAHRLDEVEPGVERRAARALLGADGVRVLEVLRADA